jgi:drug/metabolite transporter (DMT)-like permease
VLFALVLCLVAAACYNGGVVLQSSGAYGSGDDRILKPSLFARLVRVRSWLIGTLLNVVGWGFQVWALTVGSLTFVQPALGTGVFFLLGFAWLVLHEPPTMRDGIGAIALAAGVGLLSRVAPPPQKGTGSLSAWIVAGAVLAAAAVAPLALRATGRVLGPVWLATSVGFAFALTGLSSEVVSRGIERRSSGLIAGAVFVTAVFGVIGFLTETSALVSGGVTEVVPVMVLVATVVPVGAAPFLFGEHWPHSPGTLAALCAGLVLSTGGAVALAASPRVTKVRAGPHESGSHATQAAPTDP